MKFSKRFIGVSIAVCLMSSLFSGCGSNGSSGPDASDSGTSSAKPSSQKKIILKVANYFPEEHPQNIALKDVFKPMVEKDSNGAITVEIYPNNQLGAEKEFTEGAKMGTVEMALGGVMLSDQFPKLKVVEFPFLFDNVKQGFDILNSEIGTEVSKELSSVGLKSLGYTVNGARVISNSKKPINGIDDCKDVKIRVPQVKHFVEMGKALGFNVITMPMSEIFTALQQHVIDGQENPPTTILTSGWAEVQKYIALTNHIISYNNVIMNEKFYNSLSDEHKKLIEKAVKEYANKELELYLSAEQRDINALKDKGIQFTTPDTKPFKEAVQPVYEKFFSESAEFKAIVEKIREKQ